MTFLQTTKERMKLSKQDKPSMQDEAGVIFGCEIAMHTLALGQVNVKDALQHLTLCLCRRSTRRRRK